jgi:hypothetical protein
MGQAEAWSFAMPANHKQACTFHKITRGADDGAVTAADADCDERASAEKVRDPR